MTLEKWLGDMTEEHITEYLGEFGALRARIVERDEWDAFRTKWKRVAHTDAKLRRFEQWRRAGPRDKIMVYVDVRVDDDRVTYYGQVGTESVASSRVVRTEHDAAKLIATFANTLLGVNYLPGYDEIGSIARSNERRVLTSPEYRGLLEALL